MVDESRTDWRNLEVATLPTAAGRESSIIKLPTLTILAHCDPRRIGERAVLSSFAAWGQVAVSRQEPCFAPAGGAGGRGLLDVYLSRQGFRLIPGAHGQVRLEISRSKIDVFVGAEPVRGSLDFSAEELADGVVLDLAHRVVLLLHMSVLRSEKIQHLGLVEISDAMNGVRRQVMVSAGQSEPLLLRGENGTGKKRVARALHQASSRREAPFLAVKMSALDPSWAAEELLASGGYFDRAARGTLLLEVIEEAPGEVQALLLAILETGVIPPRGQVPARSSEVRVLAASAGNLEAEVEQGRFRGSLLYRLGSGEIRLPPLRERREDVAVLLAHFLTRELGYRDEAWPEGTESPWLPASLMARLCTCKWPGNVRQLQDLVRLLVVDSAGDRQLSLSPRAEEVLSAPVSVSSPATGLLSGDWGQGEMIKTLVATDLVDSTRLIESLGDLRGFEVMTRHDRVARALLARYEGLEIDKSDGFLVVFDRPGDAVAYALALHQALEGLSRELGITLETRVGIHHGPILVRRNNSEEVNHGAKPWEAEGAAKTVVTRLVRMANARCTLLSRETLNLARQGASREDSPLAGWHLNWAPRGAAAFRGRLETIEVFELEVTEAT